MGWTARACNGDKSFSRSHGWADPHFGSVELAQLGVAEEYATHVFIHLLQPDLFVVEDFADENPAPLYQLMSPLFTRRISNDQGANLQHTRERQSKQY
jgi:hypothetical protein